MARSPMLALIAVLLLAGCASAPRVEVVAPSAFAAEAATYRLADATSSDAVDAVKRRLAARGWRETATAHSCNGRHTWVIPTVYNAFVH